MKKQWKGMLLAAALCSFGTAHAQEAPPLRIIVPFAAGGTVDMLARAMSQEMNKVMGRTIVVENRAGGGGVVGSAVIAQAAPDGNTIGVIISSHAVNPGLHASLPYDSEKDFTPISTLVRLPIAVAVNLSHPAKNFKEYLERAKSKPEVQEYGSPGVGTAGHLLGVMIGEQGGAKLRHVPYRGGAPALQDLLAGHISSSYHNTSNINPNVKAGQVRVLAVSSQARAASLPDVPTIAEFLPGFEVVEWYGMAGPKGMDPKTVEQLSKVIGQVLDTLTKNDKRFSPAEGIELKASTPKEFDTFLTAELKRWPPIIRKMGLKAE